MSELNQKISFVMEGMSSLFSVNIWCLIDGVIDFSTQPVMVVRNQLVNLFFEWLNKIRQNVTPNSSQAEK